MKVFVTRQIPEQGIKILQAKGYKVKVGPEKLPLREQLLRGAAGADAILSVLTEKIDKEAMDAAGPQLKIIANYAAGYDNIDIAEAKKRGILVTNTPGILTEAVAEHTIALLFAIARRVVEADEFMRRGKYKGWGPKMFLGTSIVDKVLGIIGLGRIGGEVSRRMKDGFGLKLMYYDTARNEALEKELNIKYVDLDTLLRESDFVSIHAPLLPTTRHLIGADKLKLMKPTAYLINTSRGPIVDEMALAEALRNKTIAGAALDVYEEEPKMTPGLVDLDNTVLTPHIASATLEVRIKMSEMAAQNIVAALESRMPPNLVS